MTAPVPHSIHVLTIPQLLAGKGLRNARHVAWHHFKFGPTPKHTVSAEVIFTNKAHKLARLYGPVPTIALSKDLVKLRKAHSRTKTFEGISLVKIPPLLSLGIWIRGRIPKDDLIYPLQSIVPDLKRKTTYTCADALRLLQRSASALVDESAKLGAKWKNEPLQRQRS